MSSIIIEWTDRIMKHKGKTLIYVPSFYVLEFLNINILKTHNIACLKKYLEHSTIERK